MIERLLRPSGLWQVLARAQRAPPPARSSRMRSYGLASWSRLALACRMTDAIWRVDHAAVCDPVVKHPELLHQDARGVQGN